MLMTRITLKGLEVTNPVTRQRRSRKWGESRERSRDIRGKVRVVLGCGREGSRKRTEWNYFEYVKNRVGE